jgi:DNA invertase Pin-like site-specific DNA recombinase
MLHLKTASRYVAYYRVSTAQQGWSGLGLEAQREAVRVFLAGSAGDLAEEFTEVESGKNDARPQLARALAVCKLTAGVLVTALSSRSSIIVGMVVSSVPLSNTSCSPCSTSARANETPT